MGRVTHTAIAAGFALLAITAASLPRAASAERVNPFAQRLLDAHNRERSQKNVPPLKWSPKLAREAQQWAQYLAGQGRMIHASRDQRAHAGENLWMGSAGDYSAEFMVGAFAAEKRHFRNGAFPNVSTTGQWRDVGHYTQVIWRGTEEVGCAIARGRNDDFLVCRYWPAGNFYGQKVH